MSSQEFMPGEHPSGLPPKPSWLEIIRRRVRPWLSVLTLVVLAAQAVLLAVQLGLMYWQASIMDAQQKSTGQQTSIMQEQKDISKKQEEIANTQTKILQNTLQAQVEPSVDFWIQHTSMLVNAETVVHNSGAYEVLDIGVDEEWIWFFDPLYELQEVKRWRNPHPPGFKKSDFASLDPGKRQTLPVRKIIERVLRMAREQHQQKQAIVCLRLTYHRSFDRGRYRGREGIIVYSGGLQPLAFRLEGPKSWSEEADRLIREARQECPARRERVY
mgnify:CR=1 FL=1